MRKPRLPFIVCSYGLKLSSFHIEDEAALKNRAEDTRRRIREAEELNAVKRRKEETERYDVKHSSSQTTSV